MEEESKIGNISHEIHKIIPYDGAEILVTARVCRGKIIDMNSLDEIIKNIMEHPSLKNMDGPGVLIRFKASEVELTIERKSGCHGQDCKQGGDSP